MALKRNKKTLSSQITDLLTPAPINYDSDEANEETKAKIVDKFDNESDDETTYTSNIRKKNVSLLDQVDERYRGKKISRRDIQEKNSSEEDDYDSANSDEQESELERSVASEEDEEDMDEKSESSYQRITNTEEDSDEEDSNEKGSDEEDSNEQDSDEEDSDEQGSDKEDSDEDEDDFDNDDQNIDLSSSMHKSDKEKSKIKTMSDFNAREEIEKSYSVRNQLQLWENFLELRIKMQKCLINSNQLPQQDTHKKLRSNNEFVEKLNESKEQLTTLLNNMLSLQENLLRKYPETKNLCTSGAKPSLKRKLSESETVEDPMDEEIPSDTDEEIEENQEESTSGFENEEVAETPKKKRKLSEYENILETRHKTYTGYRNSVIQKWNDKTKVTTGKLDKGSSVTTVKQIEFALSNKPKLRKRSQLQRSEYKILGKSDTGVNEDGRRTQEYDPEIYDDDDFYHQLLRDLIESKSCGVNDPVQLSKQWIQLQNMRSKMKRKIDTRATKGRKIRFNVHPKLVNFMAPRTTNDLWADRAKDELYSSLFGKFKRIETKVEEQ